MSLSNSSDEENTARRSSRNWWVVLKGYNPGVKASISAVLDSIINVSNSHVLQLDSEQRAINVWRYGLQHGHVEVLEREAPTTDALGHATPTDNMRRATPTDLPQEANGPDPSDEEHSNPPAEQEVSDSPARRTRSISPTHRSISTLSQSSGSLVYNMSGVSVASSEFLGAIQMDWVTQILRQGTVYVVYRGRIPGFYSEWADVHRQIHGIRGRYQSFPNLSEARSSFFRIWERSQLAVIHTARTPAQAELNECILCLHFDSDGSEEELQEREDSASVS